MKLRRRGLALAVVRDPPDHRVPVNEEDLAGFEIDAGAPVQIGRIADAVSPSPWRVRLRAGRARPSRSRVLHRQAPRPATGGSRTRRRKPPPPPPRQPGKPSPAPRLPARTSSPPCTA